MRCDRDQSNVFQPQNINTERQILAIENLKPESFWVFWKCALLLQHFGLHWIPDLALSAPH